MWPKDMLKRIPHLIQQHEKEYNTIQYNTLLTLPWWGFSVTMQLTNIPIRINHTINIITTYYTKGVLKLNYN